MFRWMYPIVAALFLGLLSACAQDPFLSPDSDRTGRLSDATVAQHGVGGVLDVAAARILTGNDASFRSKLRMIDGAEDSIDAMYYIFSDDFTSSVLAQALLRAAQRGVRVRLLLDYHANYKNLDLFSMLQKQAARVNGSLEVRFYGRPTRNIVFDAAYLTLPCVKTAVATPADCQGYKEGLISKALAGEGDGTATGGLPAISNRNVGNSGLFLSGIYAKDPNLMALAVLGGQGAMISELTQDGPSATDEEKEKLKKIARIYWTARTGSTFDRLVARIELGLAFALAGDVLNPLHAAFTGLLPAERKGAAEALRDWEHLTDYLHHKLLLVDRRWMQLGGRNVEDSYHMRPNPLVHKYVFMDTDARLALRAGGDAVESAFEALWDFPAMVATIDEVRQHAPNEMAANTLALKKAEETCKSVEPVTVRETCRIVEFGKRALSQPERERFRFREMRERARHYELNYPHIEDEDPLPGFDVDPGAVISYIENLPFNDRDEKPKRRFGAENGREAASGKRIHSLWLAGLTNACKTASKEKPKRVILHNAYFFPPANLLTRFAEMVDGTIDCRHVTLTVLTNSIETTDLNVVNIFARHTAKAFAEYYRVSASEEKGARIEYFEYRPMPEAANLSLHSKVSVLGDDLIVGSANADVRSYMMDTNNALFIRHAPNLVRDYLRYVDTVTNDQARSENRTRYFLETPRQAMLEEDRHVFQNAIARFKVDQRLTKDQIGKLEGIAFEMLDRAYNMTKDILSGRNKDAGAAFDRAFKGI